MKHRSLPSARPRSAMNLQSIEYEPRPIPLSTTREILSEIASGQLSSSLPDPNPSYSLSTVMTNNDQISVPAMQIDCKIRNASGDNNVFYSEQCIYLKNDRSGSKSLPSNVDSNCNSLTRENYLAYKQKQVERDTDLMCMSMPDASVFTRSNNIAIQQAPAQQSVLISNRSGGGRAFVLRSSFSEQNLLQDMEVRMSNFNGNQMNQNSVRMRKHNNNFLSDSDTDRDLLQRKLLNRRSFAATLSSSDVTPINPMIRPTSQMNLNQFNHNRPSPSMISLPGKVLTVRRRLPEIPKNKKPRPVTIHSFAMQSIPQFGTAKHDHPIKSTDTDPDLDGSLSGSRRSLLKPLDIVKNVGENELNVPVLEKSPTLSERKKTRDADNAKSITKRSRSLPPKPKTKMKSLGVSKRLRALNKSVSTSISVASDLLGPSRLDCEDNWSLEDYMPVFQQHEDEHEGRGESIGCIIHEVRNALLAQSKIREKYSDSEVSDMERKYKRKAMRDKKQEFEGRSHCEERCNQRNNNDKEDDVFASSDKKKGQENVEDREVSQLFSKCKSRSSSGGESDPPKPKGRLKGELDDEVFDAPFNRNRLASFHGNSKKPRKTKELRRTSSLEELKDFQTGKKKEKTRYSSVSINEYPSVYEYIKSPISPINNKNNSASSRNNANVALRNLSSSSKNGIALLSTSPKRTSLKKSNTMTPSTSKTTSKSPVKQSSVKKPKRKKNSSEYDERNRENSRYGEEEHHHKGSVRRRTERDRQRDLERKREQEQLDGGLSSDQERGSSHQSTIDRSFSNNEGTPEDKIGKISIGLMSIQIKSLVLYNNRRKPE